MNDLTPVRLRDGTEAFVVPLLPANREALRQEYEHLSSQTRYDRFLTAVPKLSETMLDHLVDDVDGADHVALVLLVLTPDGAELPLGLARIIRYPDDPTIADIAVTVVDDWHGRGVATALLEVLMQHRPQGVKRIVTVIHANNRASHAMLRRLGDVAVSQPESGVQVVIIDLPDSAHSTPPERSNADTTIHSRRRSPLRRHDPTESPASPAPTTKTWFSRSAQRCEPRRLPPGGRGQLSKSRVWSRLAPTAAELFDLLAEANVEVQKDVNQFP